MRRLRDWLLDEADDLAGVLQAESGKPRAEAQLEAPWMAELINYFADHAVEFLADERVGCSGLLSATKRMVKVYRPYPVVGVISPWNYPLAMPGMDVIPALLAGSAVLLKPSEVTPLSALELARGWREIGAPRFPTLDREPAWFPDSRGRALLTRRLFHVPLRHATYDVGYPASDGPITSSRRDRLHSHDSELYQDIQA